jgi:hypothetical protein
MPEPVIPAKAEIPENTGFRIKSGMTNLLRLMPSCIEIFYILPKRRGLSMIIIESSEK